MWQIMWMLSLLPDWFFHMVVIVSIVALVASVFLRFIPFVSQYRYPLQIGGFLLLLFGVWAEGGIVNEAKWKAKVAEMEAKVKIAEEQARNVNTKIETKIVEKTKIVKEKAEAQIKYVDRIVTQDKEVVKYIENCPVPKVIVDEHNKAATPLEVLKELNKAAEGSKK
jgi:hypothetical protein